jgi:putative tryptophan/tyrosine transport system substrate-binding protein
MATLGQSRIERRRAAILRAGIRRREFFGLLAGILASGPFLALAQVPPKRRLVAVIIASSRADSERWRKGLPQGLQELGYVESRDYEIEYRYADGDITRQPALANELIQLKPSVIVVGNSAAAIAAKQATATIPIVAAATFDPVSIGLVASHAHPEGNVTGLVAGWDTIIGKQLDLSFEVVPGAKVVGMVVNAGFPSADFYRRSAESAAQRLGARLVSVEARVQADIDAAFQALTRERVNILIVPPSPLFLSERRQIAELAIAARLPTVCGFREHVEDGGLMSYGIDLHENFRRAAAYVDKIFKGAKPADLPVEQPTKFELVVNLKTAKALGLTIPEAFLIRADEVIE